MRVICQQSTPDRILNKILSKNEATDFWTATNIADGLGALVSRIRSWFLVALKFVLLTAVCVSQTLCIEV